jgi:hypothetical protein
MKSKCQVAALLALALTAAFALSTTTTIAQAPPGSLWYNGDLNYVNALDNERDPFSQTAVYDDFDVAAPVGWHVTAVFSDNIITADTAITGADWEIRSGVSEGNAGTLIGSGTTNAPLLTHTGRWFLDTPEYMVEVTGLNVFLTMLPAGQHYWLNVTPVSNREGRSLNTTTSGFNCVGMPCGNDDNAFWNRTGSFFFDHTYNHCDGCNDFSMGVIGSVVPEPTTPVLLTGGMGTLLIALRRRQKMNVARIWWALSAFVICLSSTPQSRGQTLGDGTGRLKMPKQNHGPTPAMKNKYQVGARAALLALALTAAFALNTTANAQAPPGSLWYNGDANGVNGLPNERNTIVPQAAVYDDFNVSAPLGWNVTAVFSDNLVPPPGLTVTGADWEIRTGVSEGNSGTLIASGTTNSPIVTVIGFVGELPEYMIEVTGLSVLLPMLPSGQYYWLNVTPVGNGTGYSFAPTTSGTNCVGTPCGNDDNAFWNSTYFGTFFDHTYNHCDGCNDFSMGVIGTVVPEPATMALLTCGLGTMLIALRRRRAISPRSCATTVFAERA